MRVNLIDKNFSSTVPYDAECIDDIQGTRYVQALYLHLYFFDASHASKFAAVVDLHKELREFSHISEDSIATRKRNLKKQFEPKGNPPPGIYHIKENELQIRWENFDSIFFFEGLVLSNGDTIWGTLFKDDIQDVPARLYHNIERPINQPTPKEQLEIEKWQKDALTRKEIEKGLLEDMCRDSSTTEPVEVSADDMTEERSTLD